MFKVVRATSAERFLVKQDAVGAADFAPVSLPGEVDETYASS